MGVKGMGFVLPDVRETKDTDGERTARLPERCAVVDLEAIRHNVRVVQTIAEPARVMAVVKADAYGHGAVPVARAALEAGAAWIGVAHIGEALALRAAGIEAPTLAWLHTSDSDFSAAVGSGIDLGCSGWELGRIADAARKQRRPARVHLKIDTGLGRNGVPPDRWEAVLKEATSYQEQGLLRIVGVFSHLALADEPYRTETGVQLDVFRDAVALAEDAGCDLEVRHIANSAAAFSRPDTHFDLVRTGLSVYGLSPFTDQSSSDLGLRPAMTLRVLVSHCKRVPAGQGVSYGLTYRTPEESVLGLIPLGYADGVPLTSNGGPVRIAGTTYRVAGRVAMDQMVLDLGPDPDNAALAGHEAVLFGTGDGRGPTADDWAQAAGTINYEIVTRISPRVPRVHVGSTSHRSLTVVAATAAGGQE
ncbi:MULTISPECIES: alanine racemase [unclassified Streptomyces]|uniref:alanine racemase n=2 Tax=Streptomyces TaxID=1883 RepID=UPI002DDBD60E|nr:alanine racemase [Streptomyces sp. NBC_01768]WSC32096.1 alanine racemase [Streptomyces sp. NBC_01768]WSX06136.1 alanine racemase [Streptomyces sp. NBC_00987]